MATTQHEPSVPSTRPSTRHLVRSGALAGAAAAVGTTVVAAIARAADVSLEVDATTIPTPAFAWWTIIGAAVGVGLAQLLRERRRFVVVATVAAGLSLIPPIAAPDDTSTRAVLVGAHLLAAAIIIPTLSQRLAAVGLARPVPGVRRVVVCHRLQLRDRQRSDRHLMRHSERRSGPRL